ncbi:hypothetical protein GS904_25970 [Rhodococcus hoagii]|nr:hypothetical protein [Prescottella equi]
MSKMYGTRELHQTIRVGLIGLAVVASLGIVWLMTREVAGEQTTVNIEVAIGLSVSMSLVATGTYFRMRHHKKRADRAEGRERALELQLLEAKTTASASSTSKKKPGGELRGTDKLDEDRRSVCD